MRSSRRAVQELGRSFRHPGGPFEHPETKQVAEMAADDGRQAIKLLRQQAAKWALTRSGLASWGFRRVPWSQPGSASGMTRTAVRTSLGRLRTPMREFTVPADAPPLFVLFAQDDGIGVQATELHKKWKDAGKSAKLVTFERGGHGFGMSKRGQPTDDSIGRLGD